MRGGFLPAEYFAAGCPMYAKEKNLYTMCRLKIQVGV